MVSRRAVLLPDLGDPSGETVGGETFPGRLSRKPDADAPEALHAEQADSSSTSWPDVSVLEQRERPAALVRSEKSDSSPTEDGALWGRKADQMGAPSGMGPNSDGPVALALRREGLLAVSSRPRFCSS